MFIFHKTYTDKVIGVLLGNRNVKCNIFVYCAEKSKVSVYYCKGLLMYTTCSFIRSMNSTVCNIFWGHRVLNILN